LVDNRLVDYIKQTTSKGYDLEVIRKAILENGYSIKDYDDALKELILQKKETIETVFQGHDLHKIEIPIKTLIVFSYTIISLTLGIFSVEFICINLAKNNILEYILLGIISITWAHFSKIMIKKVVKNFLIYVGYFIQSGILIDLIINKRIPDYKVGIIIVIFFYSLTYFISTTFNNSNNPVKNETVVTNKI
jgi:hypothetical protein